MLAEINKIQHQRSGSFFLMAGPCAIEGEEMAMEIAEKILTITNKLKIPFIFKGSYRKANRSRLDSFTSIGDMEALEILKKAGERFNIPTVTDIHTPEEAAIAAAYVDVYALCIRARIIFVRIIKYLFESIFQNLFMYIVYADMYEFLHF